MLVKELLELLEDVDENVEVRIAYQPNYPLQVGIAQVTDLTKGSENNTGLCLKCDGYVNEAAARRDGINDEDEADMCECDNDVRDENKVVWIATGSPTASGYAPDEAWDGSDD